MSDVPAVNQVVGYLDRIDEAGLGGWVVDFADPAAMMRVRMLIDGVTADVVTCDLARDDEIARRLPHPRIGFYYQIPLRFHDGMRHVLSLATLGGWRLRSPAPVGWRCGNCIFVCAGRCGWRG
jgi:hypothetical protein